MGKKPYDDTKPILTVADLTKRILAIWEARRTEAEALQAEQRTQLATAVQEESACVKKVKEAQAIVERMKVDYTALDVRTEAEKKAQIEVNSIREQDVRAGKVTLREFTQKGISEKAIYEKAVEATADELRQGLKAVRMKAVEVLELQKALCNCQVRIKNLLLQPARILYKTFKNLTEMAETEIGSFVADAYGARDAVKLMEHQIHLTQGKSLTPGYHWEKMSIEDAQRLQFDPILPIECIPKLKQKLEKLKDAEAVTVHLYLKSKDVDVIAIRRGRGIVTLSDTWEQKDGKFKREI